MRMWSVNVIILLLFCYASLSTGNRTVYFVSKNFFNVLHWNPVKPTFPGEKVLYTVQYRRYSDEQFHIKEECQNITTLTCDLTAETPSVPDVHYRAQVFVNGRLPALTAKRFTPIAETVLSPPILSIYTTVSSLHVNVTLPLGPNGVSLADIITSSKNGPAKTVIVYTLKITEPKWAVLVNDTTTGRFVIRLKNNRTKYCGHVVYKPFSAWGRDGSESAPFCVTLPGDPRMLLPWLITSAALLAAIVMMSVVWLCNYVKGGKQKKLPHSLQTTSGMPCKDLQSPDSHIVISTPVVSTPSDQTVYATIQVKPKATSEWLGGYSPQDILCHVWQGSAGSSMGTGAHSPAPNSQDMSAQSSEIYSAVAVHVPSEENKEFQQASAEDRETCKLSLSSSEEAWDEGRTSPKLASHRVPVLPELDAYESNPAMPLLLHTVRDTDGQLVLPSLTLQLLSSTGDTGRKPLLSDLIDNKKEGPSLESLQSFESCGWSDSGCDDSTVTTPTQLFCNNSPSQPADPDFHQLWQSTPSKDAIFESAYKQNGMPELRLVDNSEIRRTNYNWTWSGPKKEEEGEGDEDRGGQERSKYIGQISKELFSAQ